MEVKKKMVSFGPHWLSLNGQKQIFKRKKDIQVTCGWVNDDRSLISGVNLTLSSFALYDPDLTSFISTDIQNNVPIVN